MAIINLTQFSAIEIAGEDAEKYLQGQVTADINALDIGASTLTTHCDPKGKVTGVFHLVHIAKGQFLVVIRNAQLPLALDQLKKYAVFSKITFTAKDYQIIGLINEKRDISAEISFAVGERKICINPQNAVNFDADFQAWDLVDIQQGYPILCAKNQGEFIPQAMNIQNIENAISFSKGCYIGQETVARAKYRGTNKRAMYAFKAETSHIPELGTEIEMQLETGWRKTGTILSAVNVAGILWLQVVMSNQIENNTEFRIGEVRLELK